jgi:hypothetical protein
MNITSVIIIIIIGFTVLVRWSPHIGGFVILLSHLVELVWASDQPVTEVSTYTGQNNTER